MLIEMTGRWVMWAFLRIPSTDLEKVLTLTACKNIYNVREIHILESSPDFLLDSGDLYLETEEAEKPCILLCNA